MVTRNEKKELVENMISEYDMNIGGEECRKALQGLLLEDTCGGKLYKYRAFDEKGYALKNLESQTLHCSKASVFNDPFECKIAIDLNSIYEALFGSYLEKINDIYSEYTKITQGKKKISELHEDVQIILNRWLDDDEISKFLKDINSDDMLEKTFKSYIVDNWNIMCKLMSLSISDDKIKEQFSKVEESSSTLIKKLTPNQIEILANEEDFYKKLAESMDIDAEGDDITLIASIGEKMEPEKASDYDKMEQFFYTANKKIADIIDRIFYIGSLCTDYRNRLMWSHYADSHRGFCIEYDFSKFQWDALLFPVLYSEHRINMPWKAMVDRSSSNMGEITKQLLLAVLTKDRVWKYENEWRVLIDSSKKQDVKMPPISCIYLGLNCTDEENIKKIVEVAEKLGVPVKQMREDRGKYSLYPISL